MWIELADGAKTRWVLDEDCLNEGGIAYIPGFSKCAEGTIPGWLKAPERSILRESMNWRSRLECRSMPSTTQAILTFYEQCIFAGGLTKTAPPEMKLPAGLMRPRCGPGFSAEDDVYRFRIDTFEHDGIVFWTIQHGVKVPPSPRPPHPPSKLRVEGISGDRANLLDDKTGKKYSALLSALRDSRPEPATPSIAPQQIWWRSLPEWLRFQSTDESIGELRSYRNTKIEEMWWANRTMGFAGDPQEIFVSACKWLDERGFDGSGERTPARSYFVLILQDGASLNLHAQSESGDKASLTILDTLGHMTINTNYMPAKGTQLPATIPIAR